MTHATQSIYAVTLMNFFMGLDDALDLEVSQRFRKRSVGFFHDEQAARHAIQSPPHDLTDGLYSKAVIEKVESGLYPSSEAVLWFTYDIPTAQFVETPDPLLAHRAFVFG